jgi:signal transduction histidine kinase/ligand-binding sensor domain-containing protein/DNA-binding response OmpR family regulator
MIKKIITITLMLSSIFIFSQNKNYNFKHISTSEGLSQSSVIAIHQDKLGQLWLGTRDGLNKYDGHKFTVYRTSAKDSTSISNNDILSIIEDSDGFMWIGTYKGLNRYDPRKNIFKRYYHNKNSNSLSSNGVWTIKEFEKEIWFGTSDGLSIFNKETGIFSNTYNNELKINSLANNHVRTIFKDKKDRIWVGTTDGLSLVTARNGNNLTFKNYTLKLSSGLFNIQDIIESEEGNILIATANQGILELKKNATEFIPFIKSNNSMNKNVRGLIYDNENNLWAATYNGIYIIDKTKNVTPIDHNSDSNKGLKKKSIKSLFKDKKGSIWVGTYYGGLHYWDEINSNFINYNQQNSLSYNVVSSIQNIQKEKLFIGTEGGGITVLDIAKNKTTTINKENYNDLSNDNIKALYLTENNRLWIGTFQKGLNLFDVKNNAFINNKIPDFLKNTLKNQSVYAITKDSKNQLWIGTYGIGIICYNLSKNTYKIFIQNDKDVNTISNNLIKKIIIDSKNNSWVATQRGLNKIDESSNITRYFYDNDIQTGDNILSLLEDSKQNIWVGTKAKGLYKLNGNKFKEVDLQYEGTPITAIHSILEGNNNILWISTNRGIVKYNTKNSETFIYNQKNGVIDNEFNDNSSLKTSDGTFYFGSPSGITSFNEKSIIKNDYTPQVIITDFKIKNESTLQGEHLEVSDQTITYTDEINLSHTEGNFTIQFAIPSFINPGNNLYQYRLKGLEKNWNTTKNNSASYTIQNSGTYTFEVKGANSDGIWNSELTSFLIHLKSAPWKSWWAYLIYTAILIFALYYLISVLKSKTKLKQELAFGNLENERIAQNNKAKLEFFTNISHEFRTPLTLILGPLNQVLEDYKGSSKMYKKLLVVQNSANHLLTLINRLMDFRKLEKNLFKLEAAEGNIVKFLKEIYLSFSEYANDGDYDYSFHTTDDEILVYYDRYKLERVFYNLISNAFRYTPKNGTIAIRVKMENDEIVISVEDSGVGIAEEYKDKIFERFFEIEINNKRNQDYNKGTGIGLSIAKNIVSLHKGKIEIRNNKNDEGSVFSVVLPIGKAHLINEEIIKDFKFSDDISQYVQQLNPKEEIIEQDFEDSVPNENHKTILLVEDSLPLRSFMKDLLKKEYNILEAENGKIALKMAIKYSPDLIVSDVVMPVMVGTELCAAIKNELKTSHIPIILLTSRSALIYKLEGLESGADDYISKPFDINEFKLRIKNILKATNALKEKFSGEDGAILNDVVISSLDEKLYKKALKIVEENISNEHFDIPFFCSELGVSRTMLFIKIKAWTNFTPNDFIQHFRMKRAAQLLEQGKINISEVSYKVGFKNPKYFSKCFSKKYGETPSQYSNKFSDF